jgi:hypothetical protein
MKKTDHNMAFILRLLLLSALLMAVSMPGEAQTSVSGYSEKREADRQDNDHNIKVYAETVIEYTDNVFKLTESDREKMKANAVEDQASGRFKDMDSDSDYIVSPELGLSLDSNSPVGGRFSLISWLRYDNYTRNPELSHPEGRLRLRNSIGDNGELTLQGSFVCDFFKKNYLSGVNDANANGNIPKSERIYSSAVYDEYEGLVAYQHKIIDVKNNKLSGFDIQPFAGYDVRRYNSTFSNRDQDITFLGFGLDLEFISRIGLEMIYRYEWVSSPGDNELVLFDETVSGADVNGDGEIKRNAPVVTGIDRSSSRYAIEINPSFKISKKARLFAGYEYRITAYDSRNRLDIDHYDLETCRQKISSGIEYIFSKAWSAQAEYIRTDEDEDAEDGDYTENRYLLKIKYNIK